MSQRLGKYIIDSLIAEGGMAKIYRARTEGVGGIDKVVALKCMQNSMQENDEFVQMLLDEARITVRMTHKNIGQVYGLEHDGNTYFMAMEYIDGVNLATLAKWVSQNRNGFPIEAVVFIIMEVAAGLSYAHRMTDDNGNPLGIVHRDVNPQNICISREGEVKLIDFGIAKSKQAFQQTVVGTIKGKFNYMSPEQARGNAVDQRTDIFALGAVMYELLCGRMLYPLSLDETTLRSKVRMADFEPIETYMPNIPPRLHKILNKALTRDVSQRFATARDFLLALSQFFHDSCKVYDSISLSALVDHCLKAPPVADKHLLEHKPVVVAPPSGEMHVLGADAKTVDASVIDLQTAMAAERDTTIRDMTSPSSLEDGPTAMYSKDAFLEYQKKFEAEQKYKPGFSEIDRAIDLDIDKNGNDETLMMKLGPVGNKSNSDDGEEKSKERGGIIGKLYSMQEMTLAKIGVGVMIVGVILAIITVVVSSVSSDEAPKAVKTLPAVEILTMRVESLPTHASIYINGVDSGFKTPHDIPMNVSNVILRLPYYQDQVVDFKDANNSVVVVKMVSREAKLFIDSEPQKANVYINNERQESQTPMYAEVPIAEPLDIKIELEGYHRERRTLEWGNENEDSKRLNVVLTPDRSDL